MRSFPKAPVGLEGDQLSARGQKSGSSSEKAPSAHVTMTCRGLCQRHSQQSDDLYEARRKSG